MFLGAPSAANHIMEATMNEYEIGRDIQILRSRLERLESQPSPEARGRHSGTSGIHATSAGVAPNREPHHWKPDKAVQWPPFLSRFLRVSERLLPQPNLLFDVQPESKTWACQPEPLILYVNWFAGGSDEFYRFQEQSFSIVRITEPNSGHVSCTATYSARLVASGKAKTHFHPPIPPTGNPAYAQGSGSPGWFTTSSQFKIVLRGAGGSIIGAPSLSNPYHIDCQDNFWFVQDWDINAGLFDLVTGATWEVIGAQDIDHC
jgi:hypothetical protein